MLRPTEPDPVIVNGRSYNWPQRPRVVICFDGCDPAYVTAARVSGVAPNLVRMLDQGFSAIAEAAIPSFTNPNNLSIVTGAPPAVHGVSGNFYLDRATGDVVMMTDAAPLCAPSILAAFSQMGARVAAVTAKDKLRKALGHGLSGVCFSAEAANACNIPEHGIDDVIAMVGRPEPDTYSADLSLFVLDAGVALVERESFDLIYLSLSDYVQHSHAPDTPESDAFMAAVDERLGRLVNFGAVVGIVADHGMTDMARPDGSPNVLFLGDRLDAAHGPDALQVICPITDPYVRHHGALGGFVRVHALDKDVDLDAVLAFVRDLPEVDLALPRAEACARFDLPADKEGDIAIFGKPGVALGGRAGEHDLSQLAGARLRSHGGLAERDVPFIVSERLSADYAARAKGSLRNYDIFDAVLNGMEAN